jgi:hypothetical protein
VISPAEVPKIAERLRLASSTIRCRELTDLLTSLGFEVRNGRKAGHKVVVHHDIATFTSAGFTCGHGGNPEIKAVYVKRIATLIRQYEAELRAYLEEE